MAQCTGSINIMTARRRLQDALALAARGQGNAQALSEARANLRKAQEAHARLTGCTEVH